MNRLTLFGVLGVVVVASSAGCESSYKSSMDEPDERRIMHRQVNTAVAAFKEEDPTIQRFFDDAHGYVVFPTVGKGGFLIGGARGHGEVYERGRFVGYATLTQGTIGAQAGGQTYSQIIFFEDRAAMADFKEGDAEFAAQASAVAATHGASTAVAYDDGVAVFTLGEGGLMFEAAIGGQKFSFDLAEHIDPATGYAIPADQRDEEIDVEADIDTDVE